MTVRTHLREALPWLAFVLLLFGIGVVLGLLYLWRLASAAGC